MDINKEWHYEFVFDHVENDEHCDGCWSGYPRKCECGGLIHAEFGDENYDMDYYLIYYCDKCGYDYEDVDNS